MHKQLLPVLLACCPRGWDEASYSSRFICKKKSHVASMWQHGSCLKHCESRTAVEMRAHLQHTVPEALQLPQSAVTPNLDTSQGQCPRRAAARHGKHAQPMKPPHPKAQQLPRKHQMHSARRRDGCMPRHKAQACTSPQRGSGISQPVFVCGYRSVSIYAGYSSSEQISSA